MPVIRNPRFATRPLPKRRQFLSYVADFYTVVLGFLVPFSVHFVGDLPLVEVLLVPCLPILLFLRGKRTLRPELKVVYILMALWLLNLVVSDAYHHTDFIDRLRGSALIIFFALDLLGLCILIGHSDRRKVLLYSGLTVGALSMVKLQPSEASVAYPWKFGYAWGSIQVAILISYIFYRRRQYGAAVVPILAISVVNLIFNFRSPVLTLLIVLAMVFPIIPERLGALQILPQSEWLRMAVVTVLAIAAAGVAEGAVNFVTRAGYIGEEAQHKNEAQEKGGNLLLGGRPEFLIGLRAALDSPIIGHGSWAKDFKYEEMLVDAMVEAGSANDVGDFEAESNGQIPGHSHIITAWVWAGIAGLIFWGYMLWLVIRSLLRVSIHKPPLAPIYGYILVGMFWDIFFSPFAFNRRFGEAFAIVIMADLMALKIPVRASRWVRTPIRNAMAARNRSLSIQKNP